MISLELRVEEAEALRDALHEYLSDLRMEISATDVKDFRDQLKLKAAFLNSIAERLELPVASGVVAGCRV